ncbi:hypothetical protein Hanom_Chr04g00306211 [Helianthus anomalus]
MKWHLKATCIILLRVILHHFLMMMPIDLYTCWRVGANYLTHLYMWFLLDCDIKVCRRVEANL